MTTGDVLLEVKGLSKTIKGRKIIDDLNLSVRKGDIYGFLGRNGAGKSTTIRIMTGLVFPDSGEVIVGGYHLKTNFKQAILQMGAIVESPMFHGYLTGYDNLALMANLIPGVKKSDVREVLEIVGLSARAQDKVKIYSLGMRQRLGLANALLGNPKLIILDEPTNGLDPQGMREIKELIHQLSSERDITFFISSHLLHEVERLCNRVAIIDNGRLLLEGDMDDLGQHAEGKKTLEELYFEIVGGRRAE